MRTEGSRVACEHKRLRCTNGVFYCQDCGARLDPPETTEDAERVTSASGRKIGFDAEKPKRRSTKKGATKE